MCWTPETNTALLINYTPIQNKKSKRKKKSKKKKNSNLSLIHWEALVQELYQRACPTQRQGY